MVTDDWKVPRHMNVKKKSIHQTCEAKFEAEVLQAKRPVLVAFLAPWSRPCVVLRPVVDEMAAEFTGELTVLTINADENPVLGLRYEIQFIPTLLLFVGGYYWAGFGTLYQEQRNRLEFLRQRKLELGRVS